MIDQYKKGQIDMYNRLYDASFAKSAGHDDIVVALLLLREFRKIRKELTDETNKSRD